MTTPRSESVVQPDQVAMSNFIEKAEQFAEQQEKQVDAGLERAADQLNQRTGQKYDKEVEKVVQTEAQRQLKRPDETVGPVDSMDGLSLGHALGAQFFVPGTSVADLLDGREPEGAWP